MTTIYMFIFVALVFGFFAGMIYYQEVKAEKRKDKVKEVLSENARLLRQIVEQQNQQGEENGNRNRNL